MLWRWCGHRLRHHRTPERQAAGACGRCARARCAAGDGTRPVLLLLRDVHRAARCEGTVPGLWPRVPARISRLPYKSTPVEWIRIDEAAKWAQLSVEELTCLLSGHLLLTDGTLPVYALPAVPPGQLVPGQCVRSKCEYGSGYVIWHGPTTHLLVKDFDAWLAAQSAELLQQQPDGPCYFFGCPLPRNHAGSHL